MAFGSYALSGFAEAGRTVFEIAAISGHKNLKEIQTYVDAAKSQEARTSGIGAHRNGAEREQRDCLTGGVC
jgi:hypothetical protein